MGPETRFARVCLGWAPNCIHWQTFSSPPAWNRTVPYGSTRHTRRPCQIQPLPCKPCSTPSPGWPCPPTPNARSEEHTSELQSQSNLVCRLLLEKKKKKRNSVVNTTHTIT